MATFSVKIVYNLLHFTIFLRKLFVFCNFKLTDIHISKYILRCIRNAACWTCLLFCLFTRKTFLLKILKLWRGTEEMAQRWTLHLFTRKTILLKIFKLGREAEEKAQRWTLHTALAKDPYLFPSIQVEWLTTTCNSSFSMVWGLWHQEFLALTCTQPLSHIHNEKQNLENENNVQNETLKLSFMFNFCPFYFINFII